MKKKYETVMGQPNMFF